MCLEDIAISRLSYDKRTDFPANTNTRIPANPDRIALAVIVYATASHTVQIAYSEGDIAAGAGIVNYKNLAPATADISAAPQVILDYRRWGGLVQRDLWIRSSQATGYIEIIMFPELARRVSDHLLKTFGTSAKR